MEEQRDWQTVRKRLSRRKKLYCGKAGKLPTVKVNKIKCKCAVNGGVPKA